MNNSKELIQFALSNIEKQRGIMKCPICGNDYKNKVFSLNSAIILYMKEGDVVKEGLPPCTVDNTIKHNSGFSICHHFIETCQRAIVPFRFMVFR